MNIIKRVSICYLIVGLLLIFYPSNLISYWIWTPETGKWVNPKYAVKDTPKDQFHYALSFYKHAEYKRAIKECEKLIDAYPKSEYAPRAQYYIGRSLESLGKFYKAFKAYQKVIDKYPYSQKVDEIINREFKIGNMFFEGRKGKIWGIPIIASENRAIEVFSKIVKNAPYGEYADKAYYKLGMTYKRREDYQKARESFNKLVEYFPDSPLVDDAEYEAAYCAFHFSLDSSYDQQVTQEAISEFKGFISKYPDSELAQQAGSKLSELNNKRAKKIFDIAKFYESQGHKESAAIYYEEIVEKFPNTSWAAKAMEKLTILKKK